MQVKILKVSIVLFFLISALFNFSIAGEQQFSYLANSFIHGKLYFLDQPLTWSDAVFFNGRYFWPLQPLPVILLGLPVFLFQLFGKFFLQGYLQFFLVVGVFYLIYKICRRVGYSSNDSLFWSFAFCFSSVFVGVAMWPWSWYFAQVVCTLLLFLGIYEYLCKKRYLILGTIAGLLFLTRTPASFIIFFFITDLFFNTNMGFQKKLSNTFWLLLPFVVAILISFAYNYFRFGNVMEFGYNLQIIHNSSLRAREYGTFGLIHLPGNLYSFLLSPPIPVYKDGLSAVLTFPYIKASPWGLGIFFMSPYFLYLFFVNYKEKILKLLWISIVVIALPIFLYYGVGYRQYGFRYSLDFLPILFLLLLIVYKKRFKTLSKLLKFTILIFSYVNIYLFFGFLSDIFNAVPNQ